MDATEIFLHRVNTVTSKIEIEDFDFLRIRKRIKVNYLTVEEAQAALSMNAEHPIIMKFDRETQTFIHEEVGVIAE